MVITGYLIIEYFIEKNEVGFSNINQIVKLNRYNNISACCKEPAILLRETIITRSNQYQK